MDQITDIMVKVDAFDSRVAAVLRSYIDRIVYHQGDLSHSYISYARGAVLGIAFTLKHAKVITVEEADAINEIVDNTEVV